MARGRRGLLLRAVVLVVAAVASGSAVIAFSSRGDLEQAAGRVDTAWAQLRPGLDERYRSLSQAGDAARQRLGDEPSLFADIASGLKRWETAGRQPVDTQAAVANRLEGFGARLRALVEATPRLRSSEPVTAALAAMDRADPAAARTGYNQAVASYEDVRGGFPRRLVAGALGFDSRRTIQLPV
jgi:hypothetical protein